MWNTVENKNFKNNIFFYLFLCMCFYDNTFQQKKVRSKTIKLFRKKNFLKISNILNTRII